MASPIEPTPILRGEDADALVRALEDTAPPEEIQRRRDAARELVKRIQGPPREPAKP